MIEIERRADEQAGIEVGRFDAMILELGRQCATGSFDGQSGEGYGRAHAALPCSANCAA